MTGKKRSKVISFRLQDTEIDRFEDIYTRFQKREGYGKRAHCVRALLGLKEIGLTTREEKEYFSGHRDSLPELEQPSRAGGGVMDAGKRKIVGRG